MHDYLSEHNNVAYTPVSLTSRQTGKQSPSKIGEKGVVYSLNWACVGSVQDLTSDAQRRVVAIDDPPPTNRSSLTE